jgi:hypothetical protein
LERLALADKALGLARSAAAPAQELWARVWRTDAFWELGDIASADAEIERLASLAHSFRNPLAKWHLRRCQAVRALLAGRYEQAVALSEKRPPSSPRTTSSPSSFTSLSCPPSTRIEASRPGSTPTGRCSRPGRR